VSNGLRFDRRLFRDRADMFEGERRYEAAGHPGAIRILSFQNHTRSGNYYDAIRTGEQTGQRPDITAARKPGTLKYGFGINVEQELTKDIGVFGRLGWNDGKTESFAFTAIDRLATAGISVTGTRWQRKFDTVATEVTVSGLSGVHALYLARGGLDFLIGDGTLRYGPETIWESYYNARLLPGFSAAFDLQRVTNPAFNRDRGPVWISSIRLHVEFGKDIFSPRHTP
jgi:carbohydrate-selective porin OprB